MTEKEFGFGWLSIEYDCNCCIIWIQLMTLVSVTTATAPWYETDICLREWHVRWVNRWSSFMLISIPVAIVYAAAANWTCEPEDWRSSSRLSSPTARHSTWPGGYKSSSSSSPFSSTAGRRVPHRRHSAQSPLMRPTDAVLLAELSWSRRPSPTASSPVLPTAVNGLTLLATTLSTPLSISSRNSSDRLVKPWYVSLFYFDADWHFLVISVIC